MNTNRLAVPRSTSSAARPRCVCKKPPPSPRHRLIGNKYLAMNSAQRAFRNISQFIKYVFKFNTFIFKSYCSRFPQTKPFCRIFSVTGNQLCNDLWDPTVNIKITKILFSHIPKVRRTPPRTIDCGSSEKPETQRNCFPGQRAPPLRILCCTTPHLRGVQIRWPLPPNTETEFKRKFKRWPGTNTYMHNMHAYLITAKQ